jgi:putative ABC transport system permease protein
METLFKDIRYGFRSLIRHSGFTAIAIITLALGIGANTAIFSVVNGVLLRPLPFKDPERLVLVWNRGAEAAGGDRTPLAVADLLDWRAQNRSFESIGAFQYTSFNYLGSEIPEQVRGVSVTSNFLSVLGVGVQLGRDFQSGDEQAGAPNTVLLSDRFWRSHFGADPQVIGRTVNLSGVSTIIIGVMPAGLNFPRENIDMWRTVPLETPTRRAPYFLTGVARMKPGMQIQQARANTQAMKSSFDGGNFDFNLLPVNDFIVGDVRPALLAMLVAVTLVLLIAVVNVANLMLVKASSRVKEFSIRTALGASRGRILRSLLTESLLLAVAAGVLGTLFALWGVSLLIKFAPENLPRIDHIKIDGFVLAWTALVSLVTGVVFGLAPAWQSSRLNLNDALKDGGRRTTESVGRRRWRNLLVISELALAVILVTGAGLLVKSLWRLQQVYPGINPERVLTMRLELWGESYKEPAKVRDFNSRLVAQIESLPGVRAAAVSNSLPPDDTEYSSVFTIEGRSPSTSKLPQIAYFTQVSPDYFQALGITLRGGRLFTDADSAKAPQVVLINETFERRFFPAEDPLRKRLNLSTEEQPDWYQIVGVVGDVKYNGLADEVQPAIYLTAEQSPIWGMALIVKTDVADPLSLTAAVRREIRKLDPELPVTRIATMEQRLSTAIAQPRFRTSLIALFAAVALVLACVGIYGVISYSVAQRTHEIGIRMALGARQGDVLGMVIRQAIVLALTGVALGLIASFALTSLMTNLLFGVKATDPATFFTTALLLVFTALVASYLPARRATKVDPLVALRYE